MRAIRGCPGEEASLSFETVTRFFVRLPLASGSRCADDHDASSPCRLLHPIIASSRGFAWDPARSRNIRSVGPGVIESYRVATMTNAYMPIARVPITPANPQAAMYVHILPTLEISFDQGVPGVELESVTEVLIRIHDFLTINVLPKLEPFL
jgi:hypothetical protein